MPNVLKTAATRLLPDKLFIKLRYKKIFGVMPDLKHPVTFNEKLQWLKLYDRDPRYVGLVDKYEAKKRVSELIGEQYIIPTIGVWDSPDDIDFDSLPERFVLKCTHDSGGIVICRDKSEFDVGAAVDKLTRHLRRNYYHMHREWLYKNIKPRIIAEAYMEDDTTHELRDYKFFTFDGEVKALFIATERGGEEETKFDFFDADGKLLPFTNGHPHADPTPALPVCFEEMKRLASVLGKGIPHVRVDFYEVNGKVYFGEMTFYHWSGMVPFVPEEWDHTFGSWIKLPDRRLRFFM